MTAPSEKAHPVAGAEAEVKSGGALFRDYDDKTVFDEFEREAGSERCQNFVVEFGADSARVARDLGEADLRSILDAGNAPRGDDCLIRWINIWNTSTQREIVEAIGESYGFSERLRSLIKIKTPPAAKPRASPLRRRQTAGASQPRQRKPAPTSRESALERGESAEKAGPDTRQQPQPPPPRTRHPVPMGEDIELYFLLKETVNYFSIDHTDRALCIGAHWLYRRPKTVRGDGTRLMPPKHWLWLAICNDNTVLSLHEEPTIEPAPFGVDEADWRLEHYNNMRANMVSVLKQLSVHGFGLFQDQPLTQSSVRKALQALAARRKRAGRPEHLAHVLGQEGASNLFYYLFEDYAAAAPFQAARDTLNELTPIVLQSDSRKMKRKTSEIIPRLHELSKELREMRHLFENYRNLIRKIMATTKPEGATGEYPWSVPRRSSTMNPGSPNPDPGPRPRRNSTLMSGAADAWGEEPRVVLVKSAMDRFDRLGDRLQWVVLNTIQGHLEEITALSDTYFNLTQQKDSQATARLNRSAALLAKLSVLFLPVSFMTGYFGVEISDLNEYWTAETYWYSFAGVAAFSFLALFFFGRLIMFFSETLERLQARAGVLAQAAFRRVVGRSRRRGGDDGDDGAGDGTGKGGYDSDA